MIIINRCKTTPTAYEFGGRGVEVDVKQALYYYELAAVRGDVMARHNLGRYELCAGKWERALKHFMIAAENGHSGSLKEIRILFTNGHATVDDDRKALRLYQAYFDEIQSKQRDEAAAAHESFRYY